MRNLRKILTVILLAAVLGAGLITVAPELHVHAYNIPISPNDPYEAPCPNCGNSTARVESIVSQPTCTNPGSGSIYCTCGIEAYPVSFPALGHSYSSVTTAGATCTTAGSRTYTCSRCGDSYNETIAATGHSYSAATTKEASCTDSGIRTYTCGNCNDQYTETIAALGHDYSSEVTTAATCTAQGTRTYTCSRCADKYTEKIAATGHSYKMQVTKEATCIEDGVETYTCSKCKDTYTKDIKAPGHSYVYEETEATCTEEGHKTGICSVCGDKTDEVFPAKGHTMGLPTVVKEPTCTEDGLLESVCTVCGEKETETIPMTGHTYPEEWTIETDATLFKTGLMSKTCPDCGERIEEEIPKKLTGPVIAAIIGAAAVVGGGIWFFLRRKALLAGNLLVESSGKGLFKPSFETIIVVTDLGDGELLELLKDQSYLQVIRCENNDLRSCAEENGPHIIISEAIKKEKLDELLGILTDGTAECSLGLVLGDELSDSGKIKVLKDEGYRIYTVPVGANRYEILVRLILPVLKPDLKSDETLDNFGQIADLLGIPGISAVINVYVSGRDIKTTLEEGELGAVEKATIIGDIASILGLDTVESIATLVVDVDSIKTSIDDEAGAYEKKEGRAAVKDIADIISDLT